MELSLLLLGAALVKSERQATLGKIGCGVDEEIQKQIDALRAGDYTTVSRWLWDRGVQVGTGDAVGAIANTLDGEGVMGDLKTAIGELSWAVMIEDKEAFRKRLDELREMLG
jgi:hypothetical protein